MRHSRILQFLKMDATSGFVLVAFAVLAFVLVNTGFSGPYETILHASWPLRFGPLFLDMTAEEWIKDGLMTISFFVVGLELKREFVSGELSDPRAVVLPVTAALGGMIAPALLYLFLNGYFHGQGDARGWPVPVATDIAFAVAALVTVARRLPSSLRIFLLTLAVVDDLGAVVLIAILFSRDLAMPALAGMGFALLAMLLLGRMKRAPAWLFLLGAVVVWGFALKSGISTSVAGVAAAFMIPADKGQKLQAALHPLSAYIVLPLFALASAGVPLSGMPVRGIFSSIPLGIALGLAIGKPVGVLVASYSVIELRLAKFPNGASALQFLGVGCLCGIGFTMSLYIAALAFAGGHEAVYARLGILMGSVLALILGTAVFALANKSSASP